MKKILVLLVLLFVPALVYGLQCGILSSFNCPVPSVEVLSLSTPTNAHAETYSANIYGQRICCAPSYARDCVGVTPILWLSSSGNAHASAVAGAEPVCFGDLYCEYESSCSYGKECVVSMSSTNNAHLGSCTSSYDKVCCCEVDNYLTEICGDIESPHGTTPGCDGDQWCCDDETDCVWDTGCFDFNEPNGGLVCSFDNTWCPIGFYFNTGSNQCEYEGTYCDMGNPPICANVFNNPSLCIEPDIPYDTPDACCDVDVAYNGYDYYDWITVTIY